MNDAVTEQLIAQCLVENGGFQDALDSGFKIEYVLSKDCADAWEYCISLIRAGNMPSSLELKAKFGFDADARSDCSIEALVRTLKKRALANKLRPCFEQGLAQIGQGNPEEALSSILQAARLRSEFTDAVKARSYKSDFEARMYEYLLRKECHGVIGIETPWPKLTRELGGWNNGQTYVFPGFTSVGKSWLLCVIAESLITSGKKILVVSMEMAPVRLELRLDCIKYRIPYIAMKNGELPNDIEDVWLSGMRDFSLLENTGDAVFVGKQNVTTIRDVEMIVQDEKPDVVMIDGAYRCAQSWKWENQASIVRDFNAAAERSNLPWLATIQLGDSSETGKNLDKRNPNRWKVRYAKEWLIDCDNVMIISQDDDLKLDQMMLMTFAKVRDGDGTPKDMLIRWNRETMEYTEVTDLDERRTANNRTEAMLTGDDMPDF